MYRRKQGAPLHVEGVKGVVGVAGCALSHLVLHSTIFLTALSWYLQAEESEHLRRCGAVQKHSWQGFCSAVRTSWGEKREGLGFLWAHQMAASLPFFFPGEFETRCYRFSATNEGSSSTCQMCYVTDMCLRLHGWRHHATNEANDTPYFSPPHAGP